MELISHKQFNRCVERYGGNRGVRRLSCWDQFLATAFAQLTYRESLRDIEVCLGAHHNRLYHCGLKLWVFWFRVTTTRASWYIRRFDESANLQQTRHPPRIH